LLAAPGERAAVKLGASIVAFLFVQETLELSLFAHGVAVASFAPSQWCVILAAAAALSFGLVRAGRVGVRLLGRALARPRPRLRPAPARRLVLPDLPPRRSPLAELRGRRAPPLLAS